MFLPQNLPSPSPSLLMATAKSPSTTSNEPSDLMSEPLPPTLIFFITNVHHLIPIKLDQYNYNIWKIQCEGALKATSLIQHLQDSETPSPTITGPAGNPVPNPLYPKWVLADSFVRSCLLLTLTTEILIQVKDLHTVLDLWKFLQHKFTTKSNSSTAIFNLRLKLVSYQKLPNQSVADFLKNLREIAEQLAEAGSPVSKDELIEHSLRGLPPEFDSIKPVIRNLSPDSYLEDVHIRIVTECCKLESKSLASQMGKESFGGGLQIIPSKFGSNYDRLTPFRSTGCMDTNGPDRLFDRTKKAPHFPSRLNSNKGFGATTGGFGVPATNTGFGIGLSPDFFSNLLGAHHETEKEKLGKEISSEESEREHNRHLADKEVMTEVMSAKEVLQGFAGFQKAEVFQGFAGFAASTTGLTILNKPTPSHSTTTNVPWSPSNQRNATSQFPSNLNSNKWFGASPNKEWRGGSDGSSVPATNTGFAGFGIGPVAHGSQHEIEKERIRKETTFLEETGREHERLADKEVRIDVMSGKDMGAERLQGFAGFAASTTGATILNEPKFGVVGQAHSGFLKDSAALPFEEKMGSQAPQGSGNLHPLPFHGFQGSSGPHISQAKPETNTRHLRSKRHKASELSTGKAVDPAGSGDAKIPSSIGVVCSERHKAGGIRTEKTVEVAGTADVKTPRSLMMELQRAVKHNDDLCRIGTDTEKVHGNENKETLHEPIENAHSVFNAELKEALEKEKEPAESVPKDDIS